MPLSDQEIIARVEHQGMINPFLREPMEKGQLSAGLSSHGYDMRLGHEFVVFHKMAGEHYYNNRVASTKHIHRFPVLDPKNQHPETGEYFSLDEGYCLILQPGDYALGSSMEAFDMPVDVMGIVLGKSTYARSGLVVNCTPLEAGWSGHLTIEFFNPTTIPIVTYPFEGIAQVVFYTVSGKVQRSYADKKGKYQNQEARPIRSKIK